MIEGTIDKHLHLKLSLRLDDLAEMIEKRRMLQGRVDRTYASQANCRVYLSKKNVEQMQVEPNPRAIYATKYNIIISSDQIERLKQGERIYAEFSLDKAGLKSVELVLRR